MMNQEMMTMIKAMKGGNPQQIAMDLAKRMPIKDPIIGQLINFAKAGDNTNLLNLATSFFQQRGINMDDEFNTFISLLQ